MFGLSCSYRKSNFAVGFVIGVGIAIWHWLLGTHVSQTTCPKYKSPRFSYSEWATRVGIRSFPIDYDELSYGDSSGNHILTEAEFLKRNVYLVCVIHVNKLKNALAIKNTWGKHCNSLEFFSLFNNDSMPIIQLRPKSSWHFLCDSIRYVWKKHYDKLHWTLFVRDDVFVLPENVRYYVAPFNYSKPFYFGHTLLFWNQLYNVAQAGYILSRGALNLIVTRFTSTEVCRDGGKYWKNEDFYLGKHLGELGVVPQDTRDVLGRGRFHGYNPNQLLFAGSMALLSDYYKKSVYPVPQGPECCSRHSLTFHASGPDKLYLYHYLLYNLKVFAAGGRRGNQLPPTAVPDAEVWRQFVKEQGLDHADVSAHQYYELWKSKISSPDAFNEKLRREHLRLSDGSGFANMPEVLHDLLSSVQGNVSDNLV